MGNWGNKTSPKKHICYPYRPDVEKCVQNVFTQNVSHPISGDCTAVWIPGSHTSDRCCDEAMSGLGKGRWHIRCLWSSGQMVVKFAGNLVVLVNSQSTLVRV